MDRLDASFVSSGDRCAAWIYRPREGSGPPPCVVMANGFTLTRHDGLPRYAERFAAAGLAVVLFDHRFLGDSAGEPRGMVRFRSQRADWRAAIAFARGLDGVDPERVVAWGYSFAGGTVARLAAQDDRLAAAIVLCPFLNGLRRALALTPRHAAWLVSRGLADLAGRHEAIPATGPPGSRAGLTLSGEADGYRRAVPPGSPWRNEVLPGAFALAPLHRPVARARRITCPLWVGLAERDVTVHNGSVSRLAERAPHGELHRYDHAHFEPLVGEAASRIADDQVEFLHRVGLAAETTAPAGA